MPMLINSSLFRRPDLCANAMLAVRCFLVVLKFFGFPFFADKKFCLVH